MRYWWVNQKQTYRHEVQGGYLWSPKRKANGQANPFYDFMREVAPGDIVFSFAGGIVKAIGCIVSHAYEAPKPNEFGEVGAYWDVIGWRVDVHFNEIGLPIRPAEHMSLLGPLLPNRYAPLRTNGHGLQNIYLTRLPDEFAAVLIDLIGHEAHNLAGQYRAREDVPIQPAIGLIEWEEHQLSDLRSDASIPETDRQYLVMARRGQGFFKQRVLQLERTCRITGVNRIEHLRASHCKPWRDSDNNERLDGENGLLLTPSIDHLFDRGFIGFEPNGNLIISPVAHLESLRKMGVDPIRTINVGSFTSGQRKYLDYHREYVLLRSKFIDRL